MPVQMDEDVGEELLDACISGDFDQAQWILKNDHNYANWSEPEQNVSILHTMAYHDLLEACRLLLSYGADPNRTNNNGESPIFWAVRMNCFQVAMTLLEHGANVNCLDNSGSTALHYACCHAVPELIPLLLSYGCDPDIKDVDGKTALESIEREMDEDYFACTVLIRRHMKGMKNSYLAHGASSNPTFEIVENMNAFDVISIGSRVNEPSRRVKKKKFQVPRSYSPHKKEIVKKPSFVAGSKTYYLHTPNSYTQKMHHEAMKKLMSQTGGVSSVHNVPTGHSAPLRNSNSAPALDWITSNKNSNNNNNHNYLPGVPVSHMAKAGVPIMEEPKRQKSFCSLTNESDKDSRQEGREDDDDSVAVAKRKPNSNKFFALDSAAVRNRLQMFEPKNQGPFFVMPFVPDHAVAERFDVIIAVEHCSSCHLHGASVRHDKKKYAMIADECLRTVVCDVMKHCGHLRVIGLKAESKASRIGGLEVSVAIFLPSRNKNTSKDSWEWKCKSLHSKLATKSWPRVKTFNTQASDFVLEMLDIYGYAPLDELRDEDTTELEEIVTRDSNIEEISDESYLFMKNGIRPDILYVTDTATEIQEALALYNEKRDIRAVSRKEIDASYLRWVDRTYGDVVPPESQKKKVPGLLNEERFIQPRGTFMSKPPLTDRRDYICWSHAMLKHFVVYDGRLRVQHENIEFKAFGAGLGTELIPSPTNAVITDIKSNSNQERDLEPHESNMMFQNNFSKSASQESGLSTQNNKDDIPSYL